MAPPPVRGKMKMKSNKVMGGRSGRSVEPPTRQERLALEGISIEDDIDSEAWQLDYVMTEVESALQSRVDELYLLVDYHRRALLERDSRIATLEHELETAREKHLSALEVERDATEDRVEVLQRSLHRKDLELKRLGVQGRWNEELRREVEELKGQIQRDKEHHATVIDGKEREIVLTRAEVRREYARRRQDEHRELREDLRKDLIAEGMLAADQVDELRFRLERTEARVREEWERSNALETRVHEAEVLRGAAEAERDRHMREAVVLKRRGAEAERTLRKSGRAYAQREAAYRNRIRVLKATVRAFEKALAEEGRPGMAEAMRAETPSLDKIMAEGDDEDIFDSVVTHGGPRAGGGGGNRGGGGNGGNGGNGRGGDSSGSGRGGSAVDGEGEEDDAADHDIALGIDVAEPSIAPADGTVTLIEPGSAIGVSMWKEEARRKAAAAGDAPMPSVASSSSEVSGAEHGRGASSSSSSLPPGQRAAASGGAADDPAPVDLDSSDAKEALAGIELGTTSANVTELDMGRRRDADEYIHVRDHPAWPGALRAEDNPEHQGRGGDPSGSRASSPSESQHRHHHHGGDPDQDQDHQSQNRNHRPRQRDRQKEDADGKHAARSERTQPVPVARAQKPVAGRTALGKPIADQRDRFFNP